MSSDDDSFLSAYLDGELDSDQQQRVDSALMSSADLAERLRAISVVRDLVVGLHRDAGTDIAPMVMDRIRLSRRSRSLFSPLRPQALRARRAAAAAGILTVAAGALLAVTLFTTRQPRAQQFVRSSVASLDTVIADSNLGGSAATQDEGSPIVVLQSPLSSSKTGEAGAVAFNTPRSGVEHDTRAVGAVGQPAAGNLELSQRLLDSPYQRRFFVSKKGGDGKAEQQVVSAVEHTAQFDFVKISVAQGIVLDPRHPEEATVFAVLVKSTDLDRLRDQLKGALPDLLEEPSVDPAVVTQLADIGRIQALSPAPLGDVSISREALALRTRIGGGADGVAQPALVPGQKVSGRPTTEQYHSAPVTPAARSGSHTEPEHGTELAVADDAPHVPDAAGPAPATSSHPITGKEVASLRRDSVSRAPAVAKSDETMLVFVWICKPRTS